MTSTVANNCWERRNFFPGLLALWRTQEGRGGWMQALATFEQSLTRIGSNGYEN